MLFSKRAAIIIGVIIFTLSIISGDFGINIAFSQTGSEEVKPELYSADSTESADSSGQISEQSQDYVRDYNNLTDSTKTSETDGITLEESNLIEPILEPDFIERVTDETEVINEKEIDEVAETVFTIIDIADEAQESDETLALPHTKPSEECQALGARTREECDKLLTSAFLPNICREKGIITKRACDTFLIELHDKPVECQNVTDSACRVLIEEKVVNDKAITNTIEETLPIYCKNLGANTISECDKIKDARLIPLFCREKGITSEEECKIHIDSEKLPKACKDAGAMTKEGCARILTLNPEEKPETESERIDLTPAICKEINITHENCREIIVKQNIHPLCIEKGLKTQAECNRFHIENTLPNYCTEVAGFEDVSTCTISLRGELREIVSCEGGYRDACKDRAEKDYLGDWVLVKKEHEEKKEALNAFKNTATKKISTLPEDLQKEIRKSISNDRPIYLHEAKGGVVINKKNKLISLADALIVLDDDGDGLSNELEERLGTDPLQKDTDTDGFDDRTELKNGFNPSGEGKKASGLWPIDNAMIFGLPIEHPEGSSAPVDETFNIKGVENSTEGDGLVLSGKATPDSVVTVYVYSVLPMVLTVKTDSNGNWNYVLQESLVDGEHEVYVALINDIGEIERKSDPKSFFVNQARAATLEDFFDVTVESTPQILPEVEVDDARTYYLMGAGLLIVVGLIVAIFFIIRARKKEVVPPPSDPDIAV